jgi:hypothetical protein
VVFLIEKMKGCGKLLKGKSATIVILIILLIALGFTTTAAVSYWREIDFNNQLVIPIGGNDDASLLVYDVSETFNGSLVPLGRAYWVDEEDEVVFRYEVSIDRALAQQMDLVVSATDIKIADQLEYGVFIRVEINDQVGQGVIDIFNDVVEVVIKVRLLEPVDQSELDDGLVFDETKHYLVDDAETAFQAIIGQTINMTFRFEVRPKS